MGKTKFERLESNNPGTAIFKVTGKLGFHENVKIKKLVEECRKREFDLVVFDFSEISSLGGGVAKILRDFAREYEEKGRSVHFVIVKDVVLEFLQDEEYSVKVFKTLEEATSKESDTAGNKEVDSSAEQAGNSEQNEIENEKESVESDANYESSGSKEGQLVDSEAESRENTESDNKEVQVDNSGVILMSYDGIGENSSLNVTREAEQSEEETEKSKDDVLEVENVTDVEEKEKDNRLEEENDSPAEEIISEIFRGNEHSPPDWINKPTSPFKEQGPLQKEEINTKDEPKRDISRQLKRKILELKTLFSLSRDLNAVRDRRKLMDIFLLTAIAEGGVESALFMENIEGTFKVTMAKGIESDNAEKLSIGARSELMSLRGEEIHSIQGLPIGDEEKVRFEEQGLKYACAFDIGDELIGIVVLGQRIAGRGMKEEDFEFLRILVNIAKSAYENALMFEREHERTLGIVKTLISLIEENTLLKGTSEFVSRYVGMVAKHIGYPDEHFKDLIYGTVLRDMGMIKVSDLILRSPRELTKEEWEIIKRHPEDGAEMLSRMKFSEHVTEIVRTHHERFNGEGYPYGLRGREIPLGSRIISVVESYAAMIHERPNRPALSEVEALATLKENYGLRYDREIVDVFVRIIERELARSAEKEGSLAQ